MAHELPERNCATCKKRFKPTTSVGRQYCYCPSCQTERRKKAWRDDRKSALQKSSREGHLKKKFGITGLEYDEMLLKQGGACAVCGSLKSIQEKKPLRRKMSFAVDHSHKTKKVRGLLCFHCNTAIGHFREDVEILKKAISYLEKHKKLILKLKNRGVK